MEAQLLLLIVVVGFFVDGQLTTRKLTIQRPALKVSGRTNLGTKRKKWEEQLRDRECPSAAHWKGRCLKCDGGGGVGDAYDLSENVSSPSPLIIRFT
jgi:hypothetical protein